MEEKKALRQQISLLKKKWTLEQATKESACIFSEIARHPLFQKAKVVLLFHSIADEPNTHAFIQEWASQKEILLPVVVGDDLVLRRYADNIKMSEGSFHIKEPHGTDFTDFSKIDLGIIPGVAFDGQCHRLGRGKGYYDRLFSQNAITAHTIGICFSFQLVDSVPCETHDFQLDEVISGEGKHYIHT